MCDGNTTPSNAPLATHLDVRAVLAWVNTTRRDVIGVARDAMLLAA